jgi:predicted O-methyltransferase YrrM
MTSTLTTTPVAPLLARLFGEADASNLAIRAELAALPHGEVERLMTSPDYHTLYAHRAKDAFLAISRETGALLYLLARSTQTRSIVEFGTSFGISTIHLAAALRDNGGGRLIGSEFEPGKLARARDHLAAAGLADLVEIRGGDALQSFAQDLPDSIDLVLMDGAKVLYLQILALVEPRLRAGSLILADNANHAPEYLAHVRGAGYVSVPFADDIELSMRL